MSDAEATESESDLIHDETVDLDEGVAATATQSFHTEFRVMNVETVTYDLTDASPVVHLLEAEPPFRYLAIPLGLPDAVAMHQAVGHVEGRRPGTHELTTEILHRAQIDVIAARILRFEGGIFYAQLDLMTHRGHELIDCRTSDAITLALRQRVPAPVLCAEEVLAALYV